LLDTFGVVDAQNGDGLERLKEAFQKYGIIKVSNLLSQNEADFYYDRLKAISGLQDEDYEKSRFDPRFTYSYIGGPSQIEDFWTLILNEKLLQLCDRILGDSKYYFDDKIGINLPSYAFHTDTQMNQKYSDYVHFEHHTEITAIRSIHYFQQAGRQSTRFGFIPYSHLQDDSTVKSKPPPSTDLNKHSVWIDLSPRDCIFFNPLLKHTGERLQSAKYMVVLTWDKESRISNETFFRIAVSRNRSANLNLNSRLVDLLRSKGRLPLALDDREKLYAHYSELVATEGKIKNQSNQIEFRNGKAT